MKNVITVLFLCLSTSAFADPSAECLQKAMDYIQGKNSPVMEKVKTLNADAQNAYEEGRASDYYQLLSKMDQINMTSADLVFKICE